MRRDAHPAGPDRSSKQAYGRGPTVGTHKPPGPARYARQSAQETARRTRHYEAATAQANYQTMTPAIYSAATRDGSRGSSPTVREGSVSNRISPPLTGHRPGRNPASETDYEKPSKKKSSAVSAVPGDDPWEYAGKRRGHDRRPAAQCWGRPDWTLRCPGGHGSHRNQ